MFDKIFQAQSRVFMSPKPTSPDKKIYGEGKGPYRQKTVKGRIEALFLDNLGKVLTREQILMAARDPETGKEPENWHQRLSELRTDDGYTILSWRNRGDLRVQEYLMPHAEKRAQAGWPASKTKRCDLDSRFGASEFFLRVERGRCTLRPARRRY